MKDDLPTPEELGEQIKAGKITEAEAIEIMSDRARRQAFANLFGPQQPQPKPESPGLQKKQVAILVLIIIVLIIIASFML